jgi:hypothetical protein
VLGVAGNASVVAAGPAVLVQLVGGAFPVNTTLCEVVPVG